MCTKPSWMNSVYLLVQITPLLPLSTLTLWVKMFLYRKRRYTNLLFVKEE